jgi:glutathione S-transferase
MGVPKYARSPMAATLYVVPGSHPCAAVERALELKGIPYERVDLLPVLHRVGQWRRFRGQTVPGLVLEDGERVLGSPAIVRRLEALAAEPALLPPPGPARVAAERAERWGEEVLQPVVRRLAWAALRRVPAAAPSFADDARLPLPAPLLRLAARPVALASARLNGAQDPAVRADLMNLTHHLDRIDRWIADGSLGGAAPTAADLQVGAGVRLLLCLEDLAPRIDARPAGALARAQFPRFPGLVPAGALPAGWIPPE